MPALRAWSASGACDPCIHMQAYGQTTYLVTSFKRVPRGTEGAVSAEGTVAGVVAALLFAALALAIGQVRLPLHEHM